MTVTMPMYFHPILTVCGGTGDLTIVGDGTDLGTMVVGIHLIGSVVIGPEPIGDTITIGIITTCRTLLGAVIGVNLTDGMVLRPIVRVFMPADTIVVYVREVA